MDKAEVYWTTLREEAEQTAAAQAAQRVQEAQRKSADKSTKNGAPAEGGVKKYSRQVREAGTTPIHVHGSGKKAGTAGAAKMKVETKDHIIFPRRRLEDLLLPRQEDVVVPSAAPASLDPQKHGRSCKLVLYFKARSPRKRGWAMLQLLAYLLFEQFVFSFFEALRWIALKSLKPLASRKYYCHS